MIPIYWILMVRGGEYSPQNRKAATREDRLEGTTEVHPTKIEGSVTNDSRSRLHH
jgi:hypothetical protein